MKNKWFMSYLHNLFIVDVEVSKLKIWLGDVLSRLRFIILEITEGERATNANLKSVVDPLDWISNNFSQLPSPREFSYSSPKNIIM